MSAVSRGIRTQPITRKKKVKVKKKQGIGPQSPDLGNDYTMSDEDYKKFENSSFNGGEIMSIDVGIPMKSVTAPGRNVTNKKVLVQDRPITRKRKKNTSGSSRFSEGGMIVSSLYESF
jgi:hypothetical protein